MVKPGFQSNMEEALRVAKSRFSNYLHTSVALCVYFFMATLPRKYRAETCTESQCVRQLPLIANKFLILELRKAICRAVYAVDAMK